MVASWFTTRLIDPIESTSSGRRALNVDTIPRVWVMTWSRSALCWARFPTIEFRFVMTSPSSLSWPAKALVNLLVWSIRTAHDDWSPCSDLMAPSVRLLRSSGLTRLNSGSKPLIIWPTSNDGSVRSTGMVAPGDSLVESPTCPSDSPRKRCPTMFW